MNKPPPKPSDTIQDQVEQLTSQAKKLSSAGKDAQALETYRKAAELMPGAPWLQQRTAELARKLKQPDVAALHYQRAGAAFIGAGFPKRALGPLRNAWALYGAALPRNPSLFVALTGDLAELQRKLGSSADAGLSIATANETLRSAGCTERVPAAGEPSRGFDASLQPSDAGLPPESGVKPCEPASELDAALVRSAPEP